MKFLIMCTLGASSLFGQEMRDFKRSGAVQLQFRDIYIQPLLRRVMEKQLPYPEINERARTQQEQITQHFPGKKIHIILLGFYSPLSQRISMSAGIKTDGAPNIIVYMPALMDQFEASSFECTFIREIMHERDHLTEMRENPKKVDLAVETHIHALTAEFVLVPLIGKYKKTCAKNDLDHYKAWISSGRNEKNSVWVNHMKVLYGPALGFH